MGVYSQMIGSKETSMWLEHLIGVYSQMIGSKDPILTRFPPLAAKHSADSGLKREVFDSNHI
jgi:hypothetical protein